jgi:hypothetical protein
LLQSCRRLSESRRWRPRNPEAKKSAKGLGHSQFVEPFVLLSALGGECLYDFELLRRDRGLPALVGYDLLAGSTARQWLERFHCATRLAGRSQHGSFIPEESVYLTGLRAVVERTVQAYCTAVEPALSATLDVDAHLVKSARACALPTYEGYRGNRPLRVESAETGWCSQTSSAMATCPRRSGFEGWCMKLTRARRPVPRLTRRRVALQRGARRAAIPIDATGQAN